MSYEKIEEFGKVAHEFDNNCTQLQFLYQTFVVIEEVIDSHDDEYAPAIFHPIDTLGELSKRLSENVNELFALYKKIKEK